MITNLKKFKKSAFYQQTLFSIVLAVLVILGITFLVVSNMKINKRKEELNSQIQKLEEEINNQMKKNEELKAGLSQTSDQQYLEEEARERLGLKKPGEEVVSIQKVETEEPKTEEQPKPKSLWQRILEKLKF
jgi:cell division protein FtsL